MSKILSRLLTLPLFITTGVAVAYLRFLYNAQTIAQKYPNQDQFFLDSSLWIFGFIGFAIWLIWP
jgi:4-hydroxybenzoate polyprenyltransferase